MLTLDREYFNWMYKLVCGNKHYNSIAYHKLLHALHNTEFTFLIDRDKNRASDGIDLRYQFGYECGYSNDEIARYLDIRPCSVLEMMIALSLNGEQHIMDDPKYGNRTGQWFWGMINNLGLGGMNDNRYDEQYVNDVIDTFLDREYKSNGKGGLFTIRNCEYDLREVEIWYQLCWYLDTIS